MIFTIIFIAFFLLILMIIIRVLLHSLLIKNTIISIVYQYYCWRDTSNLKQKEIFDKILDIRFSIRSENPFIDKLKVNAVQEAFYRKFIFQYPYEHDLNMICFIIGILSIPFEWDDACVNEFTFNKIYGKYRQYKPLAIDKFNNMKMGTGKMN